MLHSVVFSIVVWARQRRMLVLVLVGIALAISIAGVRRLTFDSDVLALLPQNGRVIPAFRDYLARVGSIDQLYVVFTAPDDHTIGDYDDEIDAWIERLRAAPEIERVDTGTVDRARNFEWLADRRLLLLRGPALEDALSRLQPDGMVKAVANSRQLLSVPSSDVTELVRYDPLGLLALVRESLGGAQQGLNIGVTSGGYISRDSQSRLIIARPTRPPFDAAFSRALDQRLTAIAAEVASVRAEDVDPEEERLPPLTVEFAGGHRVAVETEAAVRRESIWNTVGSLALILPLLFLVYRSLWLVVVGPLPSALSLVIVLGALGFAGARLSTAATGSSAMLFGLGIDGVVLLYVAYLLHVTSTAAADGASGLTGASVSMLLGMWTTAATFYGLTFVDFPSLQQLGWLIGHSMLICGLLTLILIPALLPAKPPATARRNWRMTRLAAWVGRHRTAVTVVALAVTVVLGVLATRVRVNPTLDRLRSTTGAATLELQLAETFGLPQDVYIVTSEGTDLEPLLEANERLTERLARELPDVPVQPPTALVPSSASQARAAAQIAATTDVRSAAAALERAGAAAGFKAGTFAPFIDRLPRMLDPAQRLTYDGFVDSGLADLVGRFIVRKNSGWMLVTYLFPDVGRPVDRLQAIVDGVDPSQTLTGLPLVNRELADRFLPQFLKGLGIGTLLVVILVVAAFRTWRLSLYALLPTVIGLVWTAGILGATGIELDLFAMFAVVTFLGIGVDYGIHLVHRFREHGDAERATAELAPVILVAGAITLLGYGTLINSSYPPLRSMGVVSAVSVIALAAASVLVLPALLAGRRP